MENADSLHDRLELVQTIVVCEGAGRGRREGVRGRTCSPTTGTADTRSASAPVLHRQSARRGMSLASRASRLLLPCCSQETASASGHEGEPMLQCFF